MNQSKSADIKIERFSFTGSGGEYFGIWIVNILLTIVTLGIYSAWAKVRNNQYFYGNTLLAESSFEYTAQPLQILKGRIIAVILFLLYNVLASAVPTLGLVLFLLLMLALPWIVMNSLAFNARYSEYRGITFLFDRNTFDAYKALLIYPVLLMIIPIALFVGVVVMSPSGFESNEPPTFSDAGIAIAFTAMAIGLVAYAVLSYVNAKYVVEHHSYGGQDFHLKLDRPIEFIKVYLAAGGLLLVIAT
ncbi:MAG: DUF898 family protein [Pseudomonadota bacterium]